ncbi:hypothetical protein AYO21_09419 [Fonsecaea monophora]|uniref:Calcineurin-like phosphoesterase domain-containing protein n=1 Tax=Fonsecaea monophora TaxID=254056 RepID=A0A177EWK1_9EURO|nr:hypothetical protein AYO21_09419 [Fonsecaea monophora]OAG36434.1 hypothetical protein AYO21_09419 [Fonsecaea monophora]
MIVSQVIAAVQAALAREKIVFCVVEEVALNYYNVPRILNTLGICVPHSQLDAATKLINAHNDVFVRTAWTDQHADWKKPYPRFEAFIEEDYLTLVIFPDTHFHLQPLKHSIVDRSAYSSARPFFSNEFNFSTDISELSRIPIPRLSSLLQGLLRRFCETQDIYCAVCVEQLVDGMVLSEAWCNTHLDPGREEELKYVIGVIGTRPQRQNLFLESDYLCQDERELMKIPVALALFRSTISRLAAHKHSVSLQYMSDLHLESQQTYDFEIPRVSPYLVLAGDIGRLKDYGKYLEFLTIQCQRFWRVFLVLGNHEFYGILRQEGLETARSLEQEPCLGGKLTVLNRTMFRLNRRIAILGCTLHTSIPSESELWVRMKVADFSHIGHAYRTLRKQMRKARSLSLRTMLQPSKTHATRNICPTLGILLFVPTSSNLKFLIGVAPKAFDAGYLVTHTGPPNLCIVEPPSAAINEGSRESSKSRNS